MENLIEFNLKKYPYCIPEKLEELKKDRVTFEELMDIMVEYDEELEMAKEKIRNFENQEYIKEFGNEDSYMEEFFEGRVL